MLVGSTFLNWFCFVRNTPWRHNICKFQGQWQVTYYYHQLRWKGFPLTATNKHTISYWQSKIISKSFEVATEVKFDCKQPSTACKSEWLQCNSASSTFKLIITTEGKFIYKAKSKGLNQDYAWVKYAQILPKMLSKFLNHEHTGNFVLLTFFTNIKVCIWMTIIKIFQRLLFLEVQ